MTWIRHLQVGFWMYIDYIVMYIIWMFKCGQNSTMVEMVSHNI